MRILLAGLVLCLALAGARAAPQGHWALREASDGVRAGLVYPDYSPNEFAGLILSCMPGSPAVTVTTQVSPDLKQGQRVEVVIRADDRRAAYRARGQASELDGTVEAIFDTTLADPMLADLANARTLVVTVGRATKPLPLGGAAATLADFLTKCRK